MPFDQSRPYTLDRIVRIGITVGILYGVIMVMNYLSSVLIPFVISLLIAYLMFPLVKFFQERVFKSRIVATLVTLILFLSVAIGGFMIALPIIGSQFEKMGILLRNLVNQRTGGSLPEYLSSVEIYIREFAQRDEIKELLKLENIEALAERLLPSIYGVFSSSLNILLGFAGVMIIIFYIIFILLNFEEITNGWQDLIPNAFRKTLVTLLGDLKRWYGKLFSSTVSHSCYCFFTFCNWIYDYWITVRLRLRYFCGIAQLCTLSSKSWLFTSLVFNIDTLIGNRR